MDDTLSTVTTLRNYRTQNMKDYKIMVEYKLLKEDAPKGVYLMPSMDDLRLYFGVIFLEAGVYRNGIFKFRLELPDAYPSDGARPKVVFFSRVFHPLINQETGELDLSSKFAQWRTGTHHIATVLKFIKNIFYLKDYSIPTASNRLAAEMYSKNRASFVERAEECVQISINRRFHNAQQSTLKFTEHNSQHDIMLDRILKRGSTKKTPTGGAPEAMPSTKVTIDGDDGETGRSEQGKQDSLLENDENGSFSNSASEDIVQ